MRFNGENTPGNKQTELCITVSRFISKLSEIQNQIEIESKLEILEKKISALNNILPLILDSKSNRHLTNDLYVESGSNDATSLLKFGNATF